MLFRSFALLRACVERGDRAGALGLIASALPFATDPATRERLQRTRDALAAAERPR